MKKFFNVIMSNGTPGTGIFNENTVGNLGNTENLSPHEVDSFGEIYIEDEIENQEGEVELGLLDAWALSIIPKCKTLSLNQPSFEIAKEVIFRLIKMLEINGGLDCATISEGIFNRKELEVYNSSYPELKTQDEEDVVGNTEEEYFTSGIWDMVVDKILERNPRMQKEPRARILIGMILHNFLDHISMDIEGTVMKLVLAQIFRHGMNKNIQTYSLEETEDLTGLSTNTIIALLNDSLYYDRPITRETRLSPLDISFVYFLADHFIKESRKRDGK